MGAGDGCGGVSSPDLTCASGVCGHEFCCADSSCPSGICETQTGNCLASSSDDGSDPHGAPTLTPTPTPTPVDSSRSGGTGEHSPCGGSAAADPRATGGNVSTVGNFTIHTFTSNGTFTVSDGTLTELDVLVVGGGGGGGRYVGGGGGGGAVLTTLIERQANPGDVSSFPVVVGGGGGGAIYGGDAASEGGESSFGGMAALGGQPGLDDPVLATRTAVEAGLARDTGPSSATASTSRRFILRPETRAAPSPVFSRRHRELRERVRGPRLRRRDVHWLHGVPVGLGDPGVPLRCRLCPVRLGRNRRFSRRHRELRDCIGFTGCHAPCDSGQPAEIRSRTASAASCDITIGAN